MMKYTLLALSTILLYWCTRFSVRVLAEWQSAGWRYKEVKRVRAAREAQWIREFNAALDTLEPECECAKPTCGLDADQLHDIEVRARRNARRSVQLGIGHNHSEHRKTLH